MKSADHAHSLDHNNGDCFLEDLKPGRYLHFKGNQYEVLGVARDSETQQFMVVYRALYGDGGLWVRPLSMFTEQVIVNGVAVPRFKPAD